MEGLDSLFWIGISLLAIKISNIIIDIGQNIYMFIVNIYQVMIFISNKKLIFLVPESRLD